MPRKNNNQSAEIKSLEDKIQGLKEENKKLNELQVTQGDLFKMLVHDLKGPVGEIMANLDLLHYDKSLSEENREYLDTSILGCDSLLRMVLNILDISKMEEGRLNLNNNTFKIEEVIKEKIEKIKAVAVQNEINFSMDFKGELKPVNADREIIERVLSNLFLNALAFSFPNSEIKVVAEQKENEGFMKVSVIDQGKGIPEEYVDKIFEKFTQETKNGDRRKHSTGLGLTFCKMAIEAHKGKIWVESKEGKGSTFSFTIPN